MAVVVVGSVVALVESVPHWAELTLAVLLVVCLLWLAGRYIKWVTTSFVVTTERLILRKGVLRRSVREILLDRLTDITNNQDAARPHTRMWRPHARIARAGQPGGLSWTCPTP